MQVSPWGAAGDEKFGRFVIQFFVRICGRAVMWDTQYSKLDKSRGCYTFVWGVLVDVVMVTYNMESSTSAEIAAGMVPVSEF